jgi:carboxyl-terminal processing protease
MDHQDNQRQRNFPKIFIGLLTVTALLLSFNAGWALRAKQERNGWLPADAKASPILSLVQTTNGHAFSDAAHLAQTGGDTKNPKPKNYKPDLKPYETLDEVRRAINDNFVREKVDDTELTYGAIRGMLKSLGDRFTRFLTPEEYEEFQVKNDGEFVGIGARIDLKPEYSGGPQSKPYNSSRPYIVEPMDGGPAKKAGLQKDDVILAIDGRSTAEMSENAVVSFIRGKQGTPVVLKIERAVPPAGKGADRTYKVLDLKITRDMIEVHPVTLTWLDGNIAWLKLDEFNKKSDAEMTAAIGQIRKGKDGQGPAKGIVLDMRDNPGGLLDVAVDIGSRFVKSGPVVYTRERNGEERALNAESKRYANLQMPIAVLINKYSASAAEILTGALKDKNLATVVGEHSYGKASVQVLIELKNGGALVLTTAKYLTPSKHDISEKGIVPDVKIVASAEDEASGRGAQLQKAVALIKQKNLTATAAAPVKPAGNE